MKQSSHLARSATVAIAAALALGSTPLFAQSADPVDVDTAVVPPVAPADTTASPPASVVPAAPAAETAPATVQVSRPVVQQVVARPAETPAPAPPAVAQPAAAKPAAVKTTATTARTVTRQAAAPSVVPAAAPSAAPDTSNVIAPDAVAALPAGPAAVNQASPGEEARPATVDSPNTLTVNLIVLGGLLVLVLAILAVLYRRFARRDRMARAEAPIVVPKQSAQPRPVAAPIAPATAPVAPAAPPEIAAVAAPVEAEVRPTAEPTPIRRQNVSFGSTARTPGALPSAGASVDLPARVPEDYDERSALLKRMIEARPDKANPFRNRKSRTKRARLILQSLGRKFEDADPWIDLSQYPNNWPELARRYSQAA